MTQKAKHTPGAWVFKDREGGGVDRHFCIYAPSLGVDSNIARVYKNPSQEEGEANARLIAAAPDLLEACEASQNATTQQQLDRAINLIAAAIAKVKGE